MSPIGRHQTSGLSFMLTAMRSFLSASAHGCNGSAYPRPATSLNDDTGMAFGSAGAAGWPPPARPPPPLGPAGAAAAAPEPAAEAPAAGAPAAGAPPPGPPAPRPRPPPPPKPF